MSKEKAPIWRIMDSIIYKGGNLLDDKDSNITEEDYNSFVVNRSLSMYPDLILIANEVNKMAHLSKKMQYDFLFYFVTKRYRFSKYIKKEDKTEIYKLIQNVYKYNNERTIEALSILSKEEINEIKKSTKEGGIENDK